MKIAIKKRIAETPKVHLAWNNLIVSWEAIEYKDSHSLHKHYHIYKKTLIWDTNNENGPCLKLDLVMSCFRPARI